MSLINPETSAQVLVTEAKQQIEEGFYYHHWGGGGELTVHVKFLPNANSYAAMKICIYIYAI